MLILLTKVSLSGFMFDCIRLMYDLNSKHPLAKQYDLSSIKLVFSGGAPLSKELVRDLVEMFPRAHVGQGFGKCFSF
jgi:acyl-coenzyme A synthetase/AMP-(fatty) acid ligase